MRTIRAFRSKADDAFLTVFESLFEEIDTDRLKLEVDDLRRRNPEFDPAGHARVLARRTAVRCAASGAMSGFSSGALAIATLGIDLAYLVYQQFRLILGIATIYGHEPSQRERFQEALTCVAYGSGLTIGKHGLAEATLVAERLGTRLIGERAGRLIPVIGAISAGALNYAAVHAIGRTTIRYYDAMIDPALADAIWAEGDREHA